MIYHTDELEKSLRELLPAQTANDPILLIGKIQHEELLYWFNSSDFYLSASHYEGSGTALCEAMSCGCIPVITSIPSFRMISGNCGILYEPGNEDALYAALIQTITLNKGDQEKNVLHQFKTALSFEAIADKFLQIVSSL
jgi:glycosyltransferase involved in cell wall biosynthesis